MPQTFTAIVRQESNLWIGWMEEVPGVNCQQPTREQLPEILRITLAEALGAPGGGWGQLSVAV